MSQPASEDFVDAFSSGGASAVTTCSCGRTHFDVVEDGWAESGEREDLLRKQIEKPDQYLSAVGFSLLLNLGAYYVAGCPCGVERQYEDWIWEHRNRILKYLNLRLNREMKALKKSQDSSTQVSELLAKHDGG